tara:strand:+ start:574 stop:759 length:186 start_codon:yes stop_codon:yes gene_type:complete
MSFGFKISLSNSRKTVYENNMTDFSPSLYKELLKYNAIESNYFPQLIDLATYRQEDFKKAA